MRIVSIAFLLLTLAISTFFIHVPHKGEIGFVFNPDVKLSYNQYAWMVGEMLVPLILAWIIWDIVNKYKEIAKWYLLILMADSALWFLCYSDPLANYRITWNILKTFLFILAIAYELWKKRRTSTTG